MNILELFPKQIVFLYPPHRFPAVTGPCWVWRGKKNEKDYGVCMYHGRMWGVHRLSLMLTVGPMTLLPHMHTCHKCDVHSCCNPDHLFAGTKEQNAKDVSKWDYVRGGSFLFANGDYQKWIDLILKGKKLPKEPPQPRPIGFISRAKRKRLQNRQRRKMSKSMGAF